MKKAGVVIEIARERIKAKVVLLAKCGRCSRNCQVGLPALVFPGEPELSLFQFSSLLMECLLL